MDKVQIAREIETINEELLQLIDKLIGAEPGTEQAEALNAVANAILFLENYLYPDLATAIDEDVHLYDDE